MQPGLEAVYAAIVEGDMPVTRSCVRAALANGLAAEEVLRFALIPAMQKAGARFEAGEFYVPEMLLAARAMQSALEILKPFLAAADVKPMGRVVIGTVQGDLHDIGKNLVAMMLEGAGFEITDLGTDVPAEDFVTAVCQTGAQILALSALLTTTMGSMDTVLRALVEAGIRDRVKVIIGGAPVTPEYGRQIGADGYAVDASRGASLACSLVQARGSKGASRWHSLTP